MGNNTNNNSKDFFSFSFLSCLDLSVNNNGKTAVFLKRTFYKGVFFSTLKMK